MKKKIPLKLIAILLSFLMIILLLPTTGTTVEAAAKPELTKKTSSIVVGGTSEIKVKNAAKGAKVTYKSARKDIATVSKKGVVKGIKNGSTKITVTLKNKSKTTKLIYKVTVKKPKLSKSKLSLIPGKTAKLSVKNKPTKAKYTWLSSNSQIATVSKSGTVTAKTPGNVTIKVKIKTVKNTFTLQCNVTVKTSNSNTNIEPTGITLDSSSASIEEGGTITFTATVIPSNATNKTVTWSSSNTSVATVNSGKVTGVSAGTATITAKTINGIICICEIKVLPKNGQVLDFDEFAQEGAELIKENGEPSGTSIAEDGEFASKRLIVRGKNTQLDFTQFNPKAVIKSNDGIYLIQFASVSATKTALSEISNWPDVEWVELDTYSDVDVADNVSVASKSWGVSKIGADKYADSISSIRDDIVVAVVDTGVSNHAFLSGRILNGGFDYVDNDSDPSDKHYHGTHVAGTIVDCTPNLNVKVLPVRVLNAEGKGDNFNVGNGIKYAANHGAKVINLSLSGSHSNYIDENIEYAINKGVIVVVAAGNKNNNTSYYCPAHLSNAIVVAAVDENDRRASFSNYGDSVDIAAPGVGIISCVPGGNYRSLNGTSMATPHVAAVAAMYKLKHPSMTPAQVETMVKENVRDLGSAGWDKYYGYGIPNLSNIADVEPTGITLDQSNVSIKIGGTVTLTATVTPSNATDKTVTWSSNKTSVATVNNGNVTGVSTGTATITATTSNGKTATCTVNVTPTVVEPTGITLDQSNVSIKIGGTVTLTATVAPSNATDKTVTWGSNKTSVATVNNGKVTGISVGTATITARTSNGKTVTCTVDVTPAVVEPTGITLDKSNLTIEENSTATLTATVKPDNATNKTVAWSSNNINVATVSGGTITGKSAGTATITASTNNGKTATCTVTVTEPVVVAESVSLNKSSLDLEKGETEQLKATIKPDNVTDNSVVWSSADVSVATVDQNGTVKAVNDGKVTITVSTANGKKTACSVTVYTSVQIRTVAELKAVKNDLDGNYKLAANIDLGKSEWTPIGEDKNTPFTGRLNGNGYQIMGLSITDNSQVYSGLFGYCKGTVTNLTVSGTISTDGSNGDSYRYAGGIAGFAEKATIEKCTNSVEINVSNKNETIGTYTHAGGIAGAADSSTNIFECKNEADITAVSPKGTRADAMAGGIVGAAFNGGKIQDCENTGIISSNASNGTKYWVSSCAGGIAGAAGLSKITDCINRGNVFAEGSISISSDYDSMVLAGGIAAHSNTSGNVSGENFADKIQATGNELITIIQQDPLIAFSID